MFNCPDCKKSISEEASTCPNCGKPIAKEDILKFKEMDKKATFFAYVLFSIIAVFIYRSCNSNEYASYSNEKELLDKITSLPYYEYKKNRDGYERLSEINPENDTYRKKYNHYKKMAKLSYSEMIEICVSKGVKYYKSIDSFPYLSNGANAESSAREKCHYTLGAFD